MIDTPCTAWDGLHRAYDGRPMLGPKYAYRHTYEQKYGACPPGVAHHLCENKTCVNPDHLEFIPQGEHLRRHGLPGDWGQADKTHCPAGHEYTPENTYSYVRQNGPRAGRNERHCIICRTATKARYRERQKKITG